MSKTLANPTNNGEIMDIMPVIERRSNGTIKPGTVLNPKGKPKGTKHFSTLLMELMKEEIQVRKNKNSKKTEPMRIDRAMSLAIAKKAIEGDVAAFNAITNRTDGLPMQSVEMEVSTPPVPIYSGKSLIVKAKTIRNGTSRGKKKI